MVKINKFATENVWLASFDSNKITIKVPNEVGQTPFYDSIVKCKEFKNTKAVVEELQKIHVIGCKKKNNKKPPQWDGL